ncbi:DUF6745 domain-containing protein [Streptomyces sp. MAR4 CNX-425]|uniref:DUF6745 domain-containing protein n=1 Tax=Streptomyces sp. MAR4 CNX-425 TaxID=3406343 RepID=UPI003B50B8F9
MAGGAAVTVARREPDGAVREQDGGVREQDGGVRELDGALRGSAGAGRGSDEPSWRDAAVAARPADRPAAEAAVRAAYRAAGLAEPARIVWAGSPCEGAALVRGMAPEERGRAVREEVRSRPWAAARGRVFAELGPAGWAAHWAQTGAPLWESSTMLVERIRTGVVERLAGTPEGEVPESEVPEGEVSEAEAAVRQVLLDAVLGQHDAAWFAALGAAGPRPDGPAAAGSSTDEPDPDWSRAAAPEDTAPEVAALAAVARAAGWWWPYEHVAVVCERPAELHRDEAGRLDRGDGPALAYPDGFALHAWRGMPVPAEFLRELSDLTPERIRAEENAELRRVMLEFYGFERYLDESGAEPVHRDGTGVLWRLDVGADDEPVAMVQVVNSTPEPDGTSRTYWLRVPPRTRTAREGVAWTFGVREEEYVPVRET